MTKEEAWQIIKECKGWNSSQISTSLAFRGIRDPQDDMLDARRKALEKAWIVVGENEE